MEWWSVFFRVRKIVFSKCIRVYMLCLRLTSGSVFISISSLLWATVFSAYLARLWSHLMWAQRMSRSFQLCGIY